MKKVLALFAVVCLWEILSYLHALPRLYLPDPLDVAKSFRVHLLIGAFVTTLRALVGFALGVVLACVIHLACSIVRIERTMDRQFAGARAVPIIALMPLFVIWFGFGEAGRVIIVALTAMAFFVAPFHERWKLIPRQWVMLKEQLDLGTIEYYRMVVFPCTLGQLLGTLRVTMAICFTMAIASEYLGAQSGIGVFVDSARVTFNIPALFLAIIVSACIGLLLDQGVVFLHSRLVHWADKDAKL